MRLLLIPLLLMVATACSTTGTPPPIASSCSFEQVWDTSIAALEGLRLESADKSKGVVETAWTEVAASSRAGILQREVNKERFKYIITLNSQNAGPSVTVRQLRQQWSPMGARMRQWRAMQENSSEEAALATEISRRLKEKGC
jgi:hypothetical protein